MNAPIPPEVSRVGPHAADAAAVAAPPPLTDAMLAKLDRPGPRYTSYPTADRFVEAFGPDDYAQALDRRAAGGAGGGAAAPLSLYVHIPFCESVCYYCACNKVITKHHDRAGPYLDALEAEMALNVERLGRGRPLTQIHFGGGTPTFLDDAQLGRLMDAIGREFRIDAGAEVSIEVDPRTASPARLAALRAMGFNRLSFGVQDFDAQVQRAVHRLQPTETVVELMAAARALGFRSINADLIYGLPMQTPQSFARTIEQVGRLRPDRIALYAYAHLPQRFKPQRRIAVEQLPEPGARVRMLGDALAGFVARGYVYIGMDHFALPGDALAQAKREGRLHRNFQGYSTQPDCDLIGLGVSAIGRVGATYSQNAKTLEEYHDAIAQRQFPVVRGLALTRDDLVRRTAIMALMCQGRLEFESVELAHLVDFETTFAAELDELRALRELGLVEIEPRAIRVTPVGWYFVRAVAAVFDRHLRADRAREQFSRII